MNEVARDGGSFSSLLDALGAPGLVVVQPHDNPDHDAVAAAFALGRLLERRGYAVRLLHRGPVRSHSLQAMLAELRIPLQIAAEPLDPELASSPCVLVDAGPNNPNAVPLTSRLVAVVDHHPNPGELRCLFADLRTSYGSCATIVEDYWRQAGLDPDRATATALLMGIQMDTDFLSRRVSPADLEAHYRLFFKADWEFGARVVKSALAVQDLPALRSALEYARIGDGLFFSVIPFECTQEVISIMADFFLRLKETQLTVIVEAGGGAYRVSVRSKAPDLSAAEVVKLALAGIGTGGGHDHMAGGLVAPERYPGEEALFERFAEALTELQERG